MANDFLERSHRFLHKPIPASSIRQQRGHHAAAMMRDPGLLQELPDIPPCCRRVVVTVSRRLRQMAPPADWTP